MSTANKQDAPYADFGRHLTNLRKMAGMTRTEFARECGVALSSMQNYENGRRSPQAEVIVTMAKVLHVSTDELLDVTEMEADRIEEEAMGIIGEALSKRQWARITRSMKETKDILYTEGLSIADSQAYILSMQRLLLDAMEYNSRKYSSFTPLYP